MDSSFITTTNLFWICALLGTGLFAIQLFLSFLGSGDHGGDISLEHDFEVGNVKWLSRQAITGFLMFFGWTAITCQEEFQLSTGLSSLIGFGAGAIAVLLNAFIFDMMKKLQSPGHVFEIDAAIGKEATVYQQIPEKGTGVITLSLGEMTFQLDAVSLKQEAIPSFARVTVIKKLDNKTVVVTTL